VTRVRTTIDGGSTNQRGGAPANSVTFWRATLLALDCRLNQSGAST
jgi:hypothetical protein